MKVETNTRTQAQPAAHSHPTMGTFVKVGGVLGVITLIEFLIVLPHGLGMPVVITLFALSIVKFFLVARYFMHLRWDNKILSWVFAFGLVLAVLITIAQQYVNRA